MKSNEKPHLSLTTFMPPTSVMWGTPRKATHTAQDAKKLMEVIQQEPGELQAWLKRRANYMAQQITTSVWEQPRHLVPTFT